jgi:hypothetical protein
MDSLSNKPTIVGRISAEEHYKSMIAEQNAQIYKMYGRISDLLEEKIKLESEVERLSQLLKLK